MSCKVAEFIGSIQDGGAETLVKDYLLMLDKSKIESVLIVLRRNENSANDRVLAEAGVKIISLFKHSAVLWKTIQKINYWWYVPLALNRIITEEKIEVLHIHSQLLKYICAIRSKLKQVKLLYTCHSLPAKYIGKERPLEHFCAKKLIRDNGLRFIALHEDMRKEINNMLGVDNTVVIRNGVDLHRFRDVKEEKSDIRKKEGIPEEAFVIGHVGRFSPEKNHEFLLNVFQEVLETREDAFLILVGAGPRQTEIEEKIQDMSIQDRVLILSHRSDIPQLMKAMDVFVFPSIYEGLGIVLIEAQVAGLRCIISDTVPQEAFQSDLAVPMSLNASPEEWRKAILDDTMRGPWEGDLMSYDMKREIKRLEKLYLGEKL